VAPDGSFVFAWTNGTAPFATFFQRYGPVILVTIDILPGTDQNILTLCSRGVVSVAIFGSAEVDVNGIVFETVALAGSGVKLRGNADYLHSFRDVDGDGNTDVIVYIEVENLDLTSGGSEAALTGELSDGTLIAGTDSINIVRDDCP
jgi:hypothetical protein